MKTSSLRRRFALLLAAAATLFAGCSDWRYDVSEMGVAFRRVRTERNGRLIGEIAADTVIGGRPCKRGWVHLHANGVPATFAAAQAIDLARLQIPVGTWVFQNDAGVVTVCAFPQDTEVQGHLCRGSGGPTGVQAAFYPNGALKQYYLRHDTRLQGMLCEAGVFRSIVDLHESGRLKSCVLAEDITLSGQLLRKGTRIHLDPEGRLLR